MKTLKWNCGLWMMIFALNACIEPYDPPLDNLDVHYLVVDGFLNASSGVAAVSLTRSLPVKSSDPVPVETGAFVRIEDGSGILYALAETGPGVYEGNISGVNTEQSYRLLIRTATHREYESSFVTMVQTPPIDSITWKPDNRGVQFAVSTHDPTGAARHFRWKYVETFEYNSPFNSVFVFEGDDIVPRPSGQSVFTCWQTNKSTDIIVGSATRLSESVINKFPLALIPKGSVKLSVKYSMLVQQQALTKEAYEYWISLESTTEHLGGLFDPLPSEVEGNIQSLTDPSEPVIGLFSGGTVQEQRVFLARYELPKDLLVFGNGDCVLDTVMNFELADFNRSNLLVDAIYAPGAGIVGYTNSTPWCVDCRVRGGIVSKPTFWK